MKQDDIDREIKQLEEIARSHIKSRDEHQASIDSIENRIQELQSMPVEPEIQITRYSYTCAGSPPLHQTKFGQWCRYDDVVELVNRLKAEPAQPKYEEGKVFWSFEHEKVFILTGEMADDDDWHYLDQLLNDGLGGECPKSEIIDTPVYEYDGNRYIWDGGKERVPEEGEIFKSAMPSGAIIKANSNNPIRTVETNISGGKRKILIKLIEVD